MEDIEEGYTQTIINFQDFERKNLSFEDGVDDFGNREEELKMEENSLQMGYPDGASMETTLHTLVVDPFTLGALKNLITITNTQLSVYSVQNDSIQLLASSELPKELHLKLRGLPELIRFNPVSLSISFISKDTLQVQTLERDRKTFKVSLKHPMAPLIDTGLQFEARSSIEVLDPRYSERFFTFVSSGKNPIEVKRLKKY